MKIMAIQAAAMTDAGEVVRTTASQFDDLTLSQLGACTPEDVEFMPVIDRLDGVDFDADVDMVAITTMGVSPMKRAYHIAEKFRKRGVPVILGGPNFSIIPQEAKQHADSVVIGDAELSWPKLLQDYKEKKLAPFYHSDLIKDLSGLPVPRYDYFNTRKEFKGAFFTVEAARGCPHRCDYCAIGALHQGRFRLKPIDDVLRDIKATGVKRIFFADDNMMGNPKYYKELFRRLIPLKIKWIGQSTLMIGRDKEMLSLARKSGCLLLIIGLESIDQKALNNASKGFNKVKDYKEQLKAIHNAGIIASCTTIFGFDEDGPDVFEKTSEFHIENKIRVSPFFLLTPVPGTPLWRRLKSEGRILTDEYTHYDTIKAVFQPARMSPQELETGLIDAYKQTYSVGASLNRLFPLLGNPMADILAGVMNYKYFRIMNKRDFSAFNFM